MLGNYVNVQRVPVPSGGERLGLPEMSYLSREEGVFVDLKWDLNILGVPVYSVPAFTSRSLLVYLREQGGGGAGVVKNIKRYNTETGLWETASWFNGSPAGHDFPIRGGEGYLVYMGQDVSGVWLEGVALGAAVDLATGLNLVSLPWVREEFEYRSYEMLEDLGDQTQVSSVRRYDNRSGWQTTSWFQGSASGANFRTRPGEGYLVYMKGEKENWRPY